jgi:hypothetical protein
MNVNQLPSRNETKARAIFLFFSIWANESSTL